MVTTSSLPLTNQQRHLLRGKDTNNYQHKKHKISQHHPHNLFGISAITLLAEVVVLVIHIVAARHYATDSRLSNFHHAGCCRIGKELLLLWSARDTLPCRTEYVSVLTNPVIQRIGGEDLQAWRIRADSSPETIFRHLPDRGLRLGGLILQSNSTKYYGKILPLHRRMRRPKSGGVQS